MVKNKLHKLILGVSAACATATALMPTAYAKTLEEAIAAGTADAMHQIYDIMTSVVMPLCALALAWFAFRMFFVAPGGKKGKKMAESSQEIAFRLVFAIAIIYLAPIIVDTVQSWIAYGSVTYKLREYSVFQYTGKDGKIIEMTKWKAAISNIYKLLTSIAMPIAAAGMAYNGFKFVLGSEKNMESAKRSMLYILTGIVVLLLLPTVLAIGVSIGTEHGWDPSKPAASISDDF